MIEKMLTILLNDNCKIEIINSWEILEDDYYYIRLYRRGEYNKELHEYDYLFVYGVYGRTIEEAFNDLLRFAMRKLTNNYV